MLWRKGDPNTLLVGMHTGTAAVEKSMEFPQKIQDGTAFRSSDPTAWYYNPRILNHQFKTTYTPQCS